MTWPRTKKPRSSAQPTAHEHDSVHVAAAHDADPAADSGHNKGVSGARHTPVEADTAPAPRVNPEIAHQEPSNTGTTGYDETAGIVYEVAPARGFEALGIESELAPDDGVDGPLAADGKPPLIAFPVRERTDAPRIDTEDADPAPAGSDTAGAGTAGTGTAGTGTAGESTADTGTASQPAGRPLWNQTMADAPRPAEDEQESRGGLFSGLLRRREGAEDDPDSPPPLTRVRDLPFDQRLRIWRLRALIVVVVGVVFAVIVDWEVGVTLGIVAGIADSIYRSRTVESHHVPQPGTVDRASWRAQRRTQKQLSRMGRAGYVAMNRRPIPDSEEVIDHLVIGPTGVYAIDSEKWDKELPIRTRNGKQLWLGPKSMKDRLEHARWEAGQAAERLSNALGKEIEVRPALAVYGAKIPWDIAIIREVDVISGDRLKKYLNRRARSRNRPSLTTKEIGEIHQAATAVMPLAAQKAEAPVG
jgi:hypothetical protein